MKNNKWFLIFSLLTISILSACAQPVPTSSAPTETRQIHVSDTGEVNLVPDIAYVYIGVKSESEDIGEALDQNNSQAQAVSETIKELGIKEEDIQTSSFNVYPQQYYGPQGPMGPEDKPTTIYVVENTVFITVRDLQVLSQMLDAVVQSGANSINGINFDVLNKEAAETEARRLAIENTRSQAEELSAIAGVELGELINLNVYSSSMPYTQYEGKFLAGAGMSEVPVSAGQITLSVTADMTFAIK